MSYGSRRGFTLIEALAAVLLLGLGIASTMAALSSIARSESNARQREAMQRLAIDKYNELVGTGQATTAQNGDFSDRNITAYSWSVDAQPSDLQNLDVVTVTVQDTNDSNLKVTIDGLVFVPPLTSSTLGGTQP